MALTEVLNSADSVEVKSDGTLQIREATTILRDGADAGIPPSYHRYVLAPGDDLAGKDARIVAIANTVWTPAVIAAYQAAHASG